MKMTHSINISCSPEILFPWVAEPEKAMQWQKGVKSGVIIKETLAKTGTPFKEVMEENGKTLEIYGEITNYIENHLIAFHLESKIHPVDVTYTIVEKDNKSSFSTASTIKWKFPMNIMTLFIGCRIKKSILKQTQAEFAELKRLCEKNNGGFV